MKSKTQIDLELSEMWHTTTRTIRRWRKDGAPLNQLNNVMLKWLSCRRYLPPGAKGLLADSKVIKEDSKGWICLKKEFQCVVCNVTFFATSRMAGREYCSYQCRAKANPSPKKPKKDFSRIGITVAELARYLDVSQDTIHSWARKGCPKIKFGSRTLYNLSQVDTWLMGAKQRRKDNRIAQMRARGSFILCPVCGLEFHRARRTQKTCSKECGFKNHGGRLGSDLRKQCVECLLKVGFGMKTTSFLTGVDKVQIGKFRRQRGIKQSSRHGGARLLIENHHVVVTPVDDSFARQLLARGSILKPSEFPQSVVDVKKEQLKLKRLKLEQL